jgi:hypothetical protein
LRYSGRDTPLGTAVVPGTGGRYQWAEVTTPVTLPDGTGDLSLVLHGPLRLDWFRIDAASGPPRGHTATT